MTTTVIDWLEWFNRKERYYLVKEALGTFSLGDAFRGVLSEAIGVPIPENTRTWMDYHLDWVYASVQLTGTSPEGAKDSVFESPDLRLPDEAEPLHVNASQTDIDLLVGFMTEGRTHLVFVEAKGTGSWDNDQFKRKANRLRVIFDPSTAWARPEIRPHFVLASPKSPAKLVQADESWCPDWIATKTDAPTWVPLPLPTDRVRMERWDPELGKPDGDSPHWHLVQAPTAEFTE